MPVGADVSVVGEIYGAKPSGSGVVIDITPALCVQAGG
jgi:hypothetical protein